jgi:hypothetical protein
MKPVVLYFTAAFLFTFFLGFIDEGYNSLQTFKSWGNILVLGVYLLIFWFSEAGIHFLYQKLLPPNPGLQKTLSVLLGLILPITIIMLLVPKS